MDNSKPVSNSPENSSEDLNLEARRLLFVENRDGQVFGIRDVLRSHLPTWELTVSRTIKDAIDALHLEDEEATPPFDIVSIDLGLDDQPEKPINGLKLLRLIRRKWDTLPIVIHGVVVVPDADTLREVIVNGASYIYLLEVNDTTGYAHLLPYLEKGFLVFSPRPASMIARVVSMKPNPFPNPIYWQTLELMAQQFLTYNDIGNRLSVATNTIKHRVKVMTELLETRKEIASDEPTISGPQSDLIEEDRKLERLRPILVSWYEENKTRYRY